MKKIAVILFLSLLGNVSVNAQTEAYYQGQHLISGGYGFGTIIGSLFNDINNNSDFNTTFTGPLYLKFESGLTDKLGLGINLAYAKYQASYTYDSYYGTSYGTYTETDSYTTYSILARLNWHFGQVEKFDPYWGFGVGYRDGRWKYTSTDPYGTNDIDYGGYFPFGFELTIGAHLWLSSNFGLYAETGIAKSVVQFGLAGGF